MDGINEKLSLILEGMRVSVYRWDKLKMRLNSWKWREICNTTTAFDT